MIATVVFFRDILDSTHGNTKIGRIADQLNGGVEKRNKSHSLRSENDRNQLVADDTNKYAQSLHPAKETRIF